MKRETAIAEKIKAGLTPEQAAQVVDTQIEQDKANIRAEAAYAPQRVANLKAQLAVLMEQIKDAESYATLAILRLKDLESEEAKEIAKAKASEPLVTTLPTGGEVTDKDAAEIIEAVETAEAEMTAEESTAAEAPTETGKRKTSKR